MHSRVLIRTLGCLRTCCTTRAYSKVVNGTNSPSLLLEAANSILWSKEEGSSNSSLAEEAKRASHIVNIKNGVSQLQKCISDYEDLMALENDSDPEIRALAQDDSEKMQSRIDEAEGHLLSLVVAPPALIPQSAIVEIKQGIGGNEAGMFAGDLLRMYTKFASRYGFKTTVVEKNNLSEVDGIRDAMIEVKGRGAYETFEKESGVHRVQRVPCNQTQGKIQTSTAAVIVLPAQEENNASNDLFDMKDIRVDVMRARGAGGQHVNTTESAVRVVHIPTGISVSMQDSRSQHENRAKAFMILRARLLDLKMREEAEKKLSKRRSVFKGGSSRSDKIRTYNFVQDRVTEHRIPMTVYGLDDVLEGGAKLSQIIDRLKEKEDEESLREIIEQNTLNV